MKLRILIISLVAVLSVICIAKDLIVKPPVKPPVVIDAETEVVLRIKEIQTEKAELSTTVYTGTIAEIMTERVADVNAVCVKANGIIDDANAVLKEKGVIVGKREAIVNILVNDAKKIKEQKENAEFIKAVTEVLDPCNLDPNDPNYVNDLVMYSDLQTWCMKEFKPI